MNRYPLWKYLMVLAVVLVGLLYAAPNLFGESPAVQITAAKANTKVDSALLESTENILKQENIPFEALFLDATGVKVRFPSTDVQLHAKDALQARLGKDYVIALNLLSRSPEWLRSIGARPMYLGLDLRGGVHFLLQVDMKAALDQAAERYVGDFRSALRTARLNYLGVSRDGQAVNIRFKDLAELNKGQRTLEKEYPDLTFRTSDRGEDKVLTAVLSEPAKKRIQEFAIKQNIQTLHNRINELGVAEPVIQQQGLDRVVVQLPGVQDTAKAKEILGRTATLEIRMVDEDKSNAISLENAFP